MTSDTGPEVRDLGGMGRDLDRVAGNLQRAGARLRAATHAAAELTFEATSPDGSVKVTANGNRRITSIELATDRDPATLAPAVLATLNDALGQARAGAAQVLLAGLPTQLRDEVEHITDQVRREMDQ